MGASPNGQVPYHPYFSLRKQDFQVWAITPPPWENPCPITSEESCRLLCSSVQGFQVNVDTFAGKQVALRTDNIPIGELASLQVDHGPTFIHASSSSTAGLPEFNSFQISWVHLLLCFCSYKCMFLTVSSVAVRTITRPREHPTLYLCICCNLLWLSVLGGERIKALARRVFHLRKAIPVNQRLFSNINLCPGYFI